MILPSPTQGEGLGVRVKLMDFGLAHTFDSRLTTEGMIVGTVSYLAPEQALGQAIDGRTDLYALGVMLYELTAGHLPFTADDPITVISQHLYAPVIPPAHTMNQSRRTRCADRATDEQAARSTPGFGTGSAAIVRADQRE